MRFTIENIESDKTTGLPRFLPSLLLPKAGLSISLSPFQRSRFVHHHHKNIKSFLERYGFEELLSSQTGRMLAVGRPETSGFVENPVPK